MFTYDFPLTQTSDEKKKVLCPRFQFYRKTSGLDKQDNVLACLCNLCDLLNDHVSCPMALVVVMFQISFTGFNVI